MAVRGPITSAGVKLSETSPSFGPGQVGVKRTRADGNDDD